MKLIAENGVEYILDKPQITIGRGPTNDLRLSGLKVSRNHAIIHTSDQKCIIKDLHSTNGTFVNNQQVFDYRVLTDGDMISFGTTQVTFVAGPQTPLEIQAIGGEEDITAIRQALSKAEFNEVDNMGTRLETLAQANNFLMEKMATGSVQPFLQYRFTHKDEAYSAMLSLPFIFSTVDTQRLICVVEIAFGVYAVDNDFYDAMIYGETLSYAHWQHAKDIMSRHGGTEINLRLPQQREPVPDTLLQTTPLGDVVFIREERRIVQPGIEMLYKVYNGLDKDSAIEFLKEMIIEQPNQVILVQTPEGSYGRNFTGLFEE